MHIVQVASELTPLVKVGGLGDVTYGLTKELLRKGHQVSCFLPKYGQLPPSLLQDLRTVSSFSVETNRGTLSSTLFSASCEGISLFLIDLPCFQQEAVYGGDNEVERFLCFCKAVSHALASFSYDLLHLHDWPAAALTTLVKKPSLLTIHNLHHQGKYSWDLASFFSLPPNFQDAKGDLNLLKGGIENGKMITTVSPTYAKEIESYEGGCGLDSVIRTHRSKLVGILNGIDSLFWDPGSDRFLPFHYTTTKPSSSISTIRKGKEKNKQALFTSLGLTFRPNTPLVSAIARLVPQKNPFLLKHALLRTLEKGGQFVLLGSSSIPEIQEEFALLQKKCESSDSARILMVSEESIAHQIYAASDLFLVPSLFEPCGLTQMISLRYGTIPIVRKTGGLADTIFDIDTASIPKNKRNGFTFDFSDESGVNWALDRALDLYANNQAAFEELMIQGMQEDFSWEKPTQAYLDLYRRLI